MGAVKVLYFATARAAAGRTEEQVEFPGENLDQESFWRALTQQHPSLQAMRGSIRLARNCEYLEQDGVINSGDEVALIPPVSGG